MVLPKHRDLYLSALKGRAEVNNLIGKSRQAGDDVKQGLRSLQNKKDDVKLTVEFLILQGTIYRRLSKFESMRKSLLQALTIAKQINCRKGVAQALSNLGTVYYYLNDDSKALKYYEDSGKIYERTKDELGQATALGNIGIIHLTRNEFEKALHHMTRSLNMRKKIGDRREQAKSYHNIGLVHRQLGRFDESLENLGNALRIFEHISDLHNLAQCLANIGSVHLYAGNPTKAISYFQKGYELRCRVGDTRSQAHSLKAIGLTFLQMGLYKKSINYLLRAKGLYVKNNDYRFQSACLFDLVKDYLELHDYRSASKALKEASRAGEELTQSDIQKLCLLFRTEMDLEKTRCDNNRKFSVHYQKLSDHSYADDPRVLLLKARIAARSMDHDVAEKEFKMAVKLYAKYTQNYEKHRANYFYAEFLFGIGEYRKARVILEKSRIFFEKMGNEAYSKKIQSLLSCTTRASKKA